MRHAWIGILVVLGTGFSGICAAQDNAGPKGKPRDAGNRVDALFDKLDKNGDGVLTRDELPNAARFDALDADKDGKVTREEFRKGFAEGLKKVGDRFVSSLFKRLDTDGDGKISKAEFEAAFAKIDKDGDGYITEEELREAFATMLENRLGSDRTGRREGKKTETPGDTTKG